MYHLFQYHSSTSSCNRTAVDANGHQCLAKRKMAPQEQGRYAWMLDNERFTDMTILLTTPELMHEAARLRPEASRVPAKRLRRSSAKGAAQQQGSNESWLAALDQQGIRLQASKVVLAGASEYFRKRLDGWDSDPWTMAAPDGKLLLVVGVEEDLLEAAQAVVRLMYEEVVPASAGPLQLAKMCSAADVWCATSCMRQCFKALAKMPHGALTPDVLVSLLEALPESVHTLPEYDAWQDLCMRILSTAPAASPDVSAVLLHMFKDVHALVSSPEQLQCFRRLRFPAIKAWAGSDDLVVDSEDSVAVAMGWWVTGDEGSKCSQEQLKELSGLVRVRHLSAGFRSCKLPHLAWFKSSSAQLAWISVAVGSRVFAGPKPLPDDWLKAARKQLAPDVLKQRTQISWNIPKAELQAVLAGQRRKLHSTAVYAGGSGYQLMVQVPKKATGVTHLGAFICACEYKQHDTAVCSAAEAVSCEFSIERLGEAGAKVQLTGGTMTAVGAGFGTHIATAQLDSYLVDGCLRLKAFIRPLLDV